MRLVLPTAAVVLGAFSFAQEKPSAPTFPSGIEVITVDAVVLDRDGRPVPGLAKEDFAVSEDGKPQTIETFEAFNLQRGDEVTTAERSSGRVATNLRHGRVAASSFVVVVDDMSLAPAHRDIVRTALTRFLSDGVRDGDELIFATTSGDAWWTARIPEGRDDMLALVDRVRGRNLADSASDAVSEWEAYRISHFEGKGGDGIATGRPQGMPVRTQPGLPPESVPGAETVQRVVDRYYQRRVCIPDPTPPPSGPPMTPQWVCRSMVQARAQAVDLRRAKRTHDVLAAVDRAVFALTGVRGRKSLLLLTEGFLNDADLPGAQAVAGRCREANVAVYSLDVRGLIAGLSGADLGGAPNTTELGLMQTEHVDFEAAGNVELAEDTGGFAVRNTNDLAGGAARVAEESRVYYLLGYTPPPGKGPRDWRKLTVELKRPGLKVRARRGYTLRTIAEIVSAAEGMIAAKAQRNPTKGSGTPTIGPPLPADVARALASAHDADAIPLRAMSYVFEERPGGTLRTVITVEVDTSALANLGGEERPRTVLSLSIAATHRDSGQIRRVDQHVEMDAGATRAWQGSLTLSREFELPPGVAQARVVVRDEFLGRLGAVTVRFVVPPVTGLRVSTPVLTPRVLPRKEGTPLQPVLLARRDFTPSGLLYCQFQVFGVSRRGGPGVQVEASFELRRRDGEVVRRGSPSLIEPSPDGRLVRLLSLALDGLAEGDYELRLRVEDKATGETREHTELFRLTARTS